MQGHWNWDVDTTPFSTSGGAQPACFALKEVGDNDFKLLRSSGYRSGNGRPMIPVTPHLLPGTDLASHPGLPRVVRAAARPPYTGCAPAR